MSYFCTPCNRMNKLFDFILRYKLLHILFWLYEFISLTTKWKSVFTPTRFCKEIVSSLYPFKSCMYTLYSITWFLKFLTKKYFQFFIAIIICLLFTSVLILTTQDIFTLIVDNRHLYSKNIIPKFLSASVGLIVMISFSWPFMVYTTNTLTNEKRENRTWKTKSRTPVSHQPT